MLKIYLIVFGLIVLGGGIQGYLAGSVASIIAGGILAALLLASGFLLPTKLTVALILGLIASLAVAGRFLPAFMKAPDKSAAVWPAGILSVLAIIAIVWIVMAFMRPEMINAK